MIETNRLGLFLGQPLTTDTDVNIYSPTINHIALNGYEDYLIKLTLCSFNKETILSGLFGSDEETLNDISNENDFDILTANPNLVSHICDALSFFVQETVHFDSIYQAFMVDGKILATKNNYQYITEIIKELNCVSDNEDKLKASSKKAQEMLKRMQMFEQKQKKQDDGLEIKDVLSVLCSANGNGINIFNVGQLTIYQVYEQFERLTTKDSFDRLLPVWANGHLTGEAKLPEWIKKTKL